MKINVNSREIEWNKDTITHDEVIILAERTPRKYFVYSITYQEKRGEWKREGILNFGAELKDITDGMIFHCYNTGNA